MQFLDQKNPWAPRRASAALIKYTQRNIFRSAGQSLAGVSVFFVKICIFHNQKMHVYLTFHWLSLYTKECFQNCYAFWLGIGALRGALEPADKSGKIPVVSSLLKKLEFLLKFSRLTWTGTQSIAPIFYSALCSDAPLGPKVPGKVREKLCNIRFDR
jgi:hypothetical protein